MGKDVVLLFAGQGAQKTGMGMDLAEAHAGFRSALDRADEVVGFALSEVMRDGPIEELTRTSRCQPALYVHGLACLDLLLRQVPGLNPVAAAGLSLGEFTAHAAAGTFDWETGLRLVAKRGTFMEMATDSVRGGMAAMMGGEEEKVRELAAECDVDVANYNAPGQIVISGSVDGIEKAVAGAKEKGIRIAKPLTVAGAYHSRLMQSAREQLAPELEAAEVQAPGFPVICNTEARAVGEPGDIRGTLTDQVTGSVRWSDSMRVLLEQGHRTFVELGPGGVLAGLMKRIDREARVIPVEDVPTLEAAVTELS